MTSALAAPPSLKVPISTSPPNTSSATLYALPASSSSSAAASSTSSSLGSSPSPLLTATGSSSLNLMSASNAVSISIAQPLKLDRPTKALPQLPPVQETVSYSLLFSIVSSSADASLLLVTRSFILLGRNSESIKWKWSETRSRKR